MKTKKVAIIMGSQTDFKVMKEASDILRQLKVPFDIKVISAHRTPSEMVDFAKHAHENYAVIIAGAGGAAHLPGMVASLTLLPVIGVPVTIGQLKGLDALLSISQMPKGVPVATVAIDNASNAGLLAARILGLVDSKLRKELTTFQISQKKAVTRMNKSLQALRRKR